MSKSININDFTLDELEKLEMITGLTFDEIGKQFTRPRVLKGVLWINELRTNPEAKIEDFGNLSLDNALEVFTGEDPKA